MEMLGVSRRDDVIIGVVLGWIIIQICIGKVVQ